jgi:hypothetical protein
MPTTRINVLKIGGLEQIAEAWRLSRDLSRDDVPLEEVVGIDVPVNEMAVAELHFENFTVIEREIFTTPRNHSLWARTSHVDDAVEFQVPDGVVHDPGFVVRQRDKMKRAKARGLSLDEYRFDMPVVAATSWTQTISFRDTVKMAKYFNYLHGAVADGLKPRIRKIENHLLAVIDEFCEYRGHLGTKAIKSMRTETFLHEGTIDGTIAGHVSMNGTMTIPMVVPLWLRAQIVRHRPLGFVDDFFWKILSTEEYAVSTLSTPINMEIRTDRWFWRKILGKRTCWLAQDSLLNKKDLWQEIVDRTPGGFTPDMMPCASGSCPYEGDAALRLTDQDPGVPCPRYMNIKGLDKTEHVAAMKVAARSRHPYWKLEIEAEMRETV